jgi:SAM-dependent methyltransferase
MSIANRQINAYEEVLYPAGIFPETHPDRLATIGTLRGMRPVSINSCRVLEMACGTGNNLIAMASNLSGSEFIGVDLAENAITSGRALVAGLGLENIRLHHLDVCHLNREGFGRFDYIIAHVNGPQIGRDSLLIGAGAAVLLSDRISIYAYYDGELGRTNYQSNNVSAGVRMTF